MAAVHLASLLMAADQPQCCAQPTGMGRDAEPTIAGLPEHSWSSCTIEYRLQLAPGPGLPACSHDSAHPAAVVVSFCVKVLRSHGPPSKGPHYHPQPVALPACSYNRAMPMPEDYAKEPPGVPPHLQLTLLNVPAAPESASALPRPQHVVLNHLYCQRNTGLNALIIGTTHRYRNKYVTTVMYKPRRRYKTAVDAGLHLNQQLPQQQQEPRLQTAPQLGGQHHEAGSGHTSPRPIPVRNSM